MRVLSSALLLLHCTNVASTVIVSNSFRGKVSDDSEILSDPIHNNRWIHGHGDDSSRLSEQLSQTSPVDTETESSVLLGTPKEKPPQYPPFKVRDATQKDLDALGITAKEMNHNCKTFYPKFSGSEKYHLPSQWDKNNIKRAKLEVLKLTVKSIVWGDKQVINNGPVKGKQCVGATNNTNTEKTFHSSLTDSFTQSVSSTTTKTLGFSDSFSVGLNVGDVFSIKNTMTISASSSSSNTNFDSTTQTVSTSVDNPVMPGTESCACIEGTSYQYQAPWTGYVCIEGYYLCEYKHKQNGHWDWYANLPEKCGTIEGEAIMSLASNFHVEFSDGLCGPPS